jgi:phospholipase/carboxylesterase
VASPIALHATPHPFARAGGAPTGMRPLSAERRAGLLVVPARYRPDRPAPLLALLHGAGGDAAGTVALLAPLRRSIPSAILVAPESRDETWDVIASAIGPDAAALDAALASVFDRYAVDPARVAVAGFSDGASYALTLALANGTLFRAVIAFSPGFEAAPAHRGRPRVFVSHGSRDRVLPVERTSRRVVPALEAEGYDVRYREFDGAHAVPARVQVESARWLGWDGAGGAPA